MTILIAFLFFVIYQLLIPFPAHSENLLSPHLLEPEAYSETYSIVVTDKSVGYIKVELAISNLGLGDQNAMCRIDHLGPDFQWSADELYGREDWQFDPKGTLVVGSCSLDVATGAPIVKVDLNDRSFRIMFANPLKEVIPKNHLIVTGDRFFNQHILLAWSSVILVTSKVGEEEFHSTGHGMIHRFWTTAWPPELAEYWIRAYHLGSGGSFSLFAWKPLEKNGMNGFVLFPDGAIPAVIEECNLLNEHPEEYNIRVVAGKSSFEIKTDHRLSRHAPIEQLGAFKFLITPWLGNPVTQTFSATMSSAGSTVQEQVFFELTTLD
ncbi:hypothetical protein KJ966_05330 [bacterium]|nr:hypothetical protein [bacterium]